MAKIDPTLDNLQESVDAIVLALISLDELLCERGVLMPGDWAEMLRDTGRSLPEANLEHMAQLLDSARAVQNVKLDLIEGGKKDD